MAADSLVDVIASVEQEGTRASVKAWLKRIGEPVEAGEPLLELETDKVAMEVPAPASGVLAEILVADGQDASPGSVLGRITGTAVAGVAGPPPAAVGVAAVASAGLR